MKRKKSSLITKIIVLAIAVYATISLLSLQAKIAEAELRKQELTEGIEALTVENKKLQNEIDSFDIDERAAKIAREKLGLVSYGEIVFYDISS